MSELRGAWVWPLAVVLTLAPGAVRLCGDVVGCECDPARPETLTARQCSLCREALRQTASVFFLKDINPGKPNRWLALPLSHEHSVDAMTPEKRTELWRATISKAKELFGDDWAVALNGTKVRTQCHTHIHMGKLLPGVETDHAVTVTNFWEIPAPDGGGLWIHPQGNLYHVHLGEQITETVLLR